MEDWDKLIFEKKIEGMTKEIKRLNNSLRIRMLLIETQDKLIKKLEKK